MDDNRWILFVRASERVFDNWTLMSLAVSQGWGGRDSAKKKARLLSDIQERLSDNTKLSVNNKDDVRDLQEDLAYELVERFNCEVDDGSDTEVAEILLRLLSTLRDGDETYANKIVKSGKNDNAMLNCVNGSPASDSDDDDADSTPGGAEIAKPAPTNTAPVVDDDGFMTVTKGKKKNKAPQVPEKEPKAADPAAAQQSPEPSTKATSDKSQVANGRVVEAKVPVVAAAYPSVDDDGFTVVKKGKKNGKVDQAKATVDDVAAAPLAPGARWADVSDDDDDVIAAPAPVDEWQTVGKKGPKKK
jgi:pre-rRNA-processing protein TSR2